jgi:translation initiation factor 2 subunit 1
MYRQTFPSNDQIVMAKIISVDDLGAYCSLPEFRDAEAFLPIKEFARKRMRSIKKVIRVGESYPLIVISVDESKKTIDLSKKHVTPEEETECNDRFKKSRIVDSIVQRTAVVTHVEPSFIYSQYIWPLYDAHRHAFDAFENMIQCDSFSCWNCSELDSNVKVELIHTIQKRIQRKRYKILAHFRLFCFGMDGINAIKSALEAGEQYTAPRGGSEPEEDEEDAREVSLGSVSCPDYLLSVTSSDEAEAEEMVECIFSAIESKIKEFNGGIFERRNVERLS